MDIGEDTLGGDLDFYNDGDDVMMSVERENVGDEPLRADENDADHDSETSCNDLDSRAFESFNVLVWFFFCANL